MFINYLKITIRNILKYKTYTIINIFGLSVGISVFVLIMLFVQNEKRYDTFNKNYHRVYRIVSGNPGDKNAFAGTPAPLGPALSEYIAGIDNTCYIPSASGRLMTYGFDGRPDFSGRPDCVMSWGSGSTPPLKKGAKLIVVNTIETEAARRADILPKQLCSDHDLAAIARARPTTAEELTEVTSFGAITAERLAPQILDVVREAAGSADRSGPAQSARSTMTGA